ncbi:toprim domain-containing protein [Lactococcus lactis]
MDIISFAEHEGEKFREQGHLAVFQSLEGAHTKLATAVQAVEDFKTKYGQLPDEVIIATDNDKDGNLVEDKFKALSPVQEYMKQGMKVVRAKPDHGKDWNDALKFSKSPTQQVPHPRISPNLPKGRSM